MSRSSFVHAPFLYRKGMLLVQCAFFFGDKTFRLQYGADVFLINENSADPTEFSNSKRRNFLCRM